MSNTSNRFDTDILKKAANWCLKSKKYFLAAILFIALSFLLHSCTGNTVTEQKDAAATEMETEETQSILNDFEMAGQFEQDKIPELNELINQYFIAYAANDQETLAALATPMTDNEKKYIEVFSEFIDSYENVSCYSKPGPEDNSYMVCVYFDMKFKDVETLAPGLDFFYVNTDENGKLYINNLYSPYNLSRTESELDPSVYAVILQFEQQEDAVALRTKVQKAYEAAVSSDVNLATMISTTIPDAMTNWMEQINAAATPETEETEVTETTEAVENTENAQQADNTADNAENTDAVENTDNAAENADAAENTDNAAENADAAENTDNAAENAENTDNDKNKESSKVKVTADSVNVRKTADTSGTFMGEAKKGDVFKKLGTEGDWTKVKFNDEEGYIKSEFLSVE